MKIFFCLILFFSYLNPLHATHIAGGELFYEYVGTGSAANTEKYKITMRLFRECSSVGAALNGEDVTIGIYSTATLTLKNTVTLIQQFVAPPPFIQNTPGINPCLTGNPVACYQIGTYSNTIDLDITTDGYTLSWIRYTRTSLVNAFSSPTTTGATFTTQIPGSNQLSAGHNSSPQFLITDTSIVCRSSAFSLNFSAIDADNDSLAYKFEPAYDGPVPLDPSLSPNPPPPPILKIVQMNYLGSYSGFSPLGIAVNINSKTGIVSGIAPPVGKYVICVVAEEWRNGILLNKHRKDFIFTIADCSITAAALNPTYITCDGYTMSFQNESTSAPTNYFWNFGDVNNTTKDTSTTPLPTYTYKAAGDFTLKLKVKTSGGCEDSATALVKVYPGFTPNLNITGSCFLNPYQFVDKTTTAYGYVDTVKWDFGVPLLTTDTASGSPVNFTYFTSGTYAIKMHVTNSKGCRKDTIVNLIVPDKPFIQLPFKDTLICSIDTLQLFATASSGVYTWSSTNTNISSKNILSPYVFPKDTATYILTVSNNGCINSDTIKVNVLPYISVKAGADTSICSSDIIQLHPTSEALSYQWITSTGILINNIKNPLIQPLSNTKYFVTANLGKCQAKDSVFVKVAPYPFAKAFPDTTICFGNRVQLSSNIIGSQFSWQPTNNLYKANTAFPLAGPVKTTSYILSVSDTLGCPKISNDTIVIKVIPPISVNAGPDTSVVINQPLQLNVLLNDTSVHSFIWFPITGLNNATIANPIAMVGAGFDSIKYSIKAFNNFGCFGEDFITVHIFQNKPDILVPSAFTPNGDGKNDIIKPIVIGISTLDYFRIFNRWGQLIFSTSEINKGWDGTLSGTPQQSGTYVYMAQGKDYLGNLIFKKGTIVLIR